MHRKDGRTTDDIYENDDIIKGNIGKEITDSTQRNTSELAESDSVRIRSSRAALVCLMLLCVLLLTAVIVLGVYIHTKSTNYTEERDQLLTKITSLTKERGQLITNLTEERDQLIIQNGNLTKERDQLKSEKNKQICFDKVDGWTNYQYSVYFISSEKKNWTESRKYCTDRGADLIIINNRAEQNFVKNITSSADSVWIGLTDRDVEGTWKWVDGTSVTSG
ncbi:C-type lectin domain family 17, member A [Anabarilius grahami]|uniref:C-type lectin domain family 17, member A n=1 Tax=Anabarilius grahami TaxID=495550 RepID=A0A3N0Z4G4_ANAGA|nr:C-type lectin domain family 17, member A [Anabarilius grahami]